MRELAFDAERMVRKHCFGKERCTCVSLTRSAVAIAHAESLCGNGKSDLTALAPAAVRWMFGIHEAPDRGA